MDLTPETLRSATFRDKLRGYHPDDVDEFLESVARGLEVLLARLRDATEKARGLVPQEPLPQTDEAVRTLALAQRTADLAIQEAKAEAERLVKTAEQSVRRVVDDAETSAVSIAEAAQAELRADLERLQNARDQLVGEVQTLGAWLEGERGRIRRALIEIADRIENVRDAGDAPVPKPVSVPEPPRQKRDAVRAAGGSARLSEREPKRDELPVERARAEVTPAVERPRANVVPPPAAPSPQSPRQAAPPASQPAIRTTSPRTMVPSNRPPSSFSDSAVISRAQEARTPEAASDDDPFFAELRAAMRDHKPLGPREDDGGDENPGS